MKLFQVRCDSCGVKESLKYNGEHYLLPKDWVELHDETKGLLNKYLCSLCRKLRPIQIARGKGKNAR